MNKLGNVVVYGAGSWGTALALQLARNGLEVWLWGNEQQHIAHIEQQRENTQYLPGITFPDSLYCEADLATVAAKSHYHLSVVPTFATRSLFQRLKPLLSEQDAVLWASKGIELDSGKLLHEVVQEELPFCQRYGVLSGPTFAGEVARGLPTAMTIAANDELLAREMAAAFQADNYRAYTSLDVVGVELGGAVKNVLAIAAGISDGLGFGANARAAIITRGLAEINRLGECLGAKSETLMGLSGVGDLVLTCTDNQSRNRRLGLAIGQGKSMQQAIADIGQEVEGAKTARSIGLLAERVNVEMPICQQVYRILYQNLSPTQAVQTLISRDLKAEFQAG